MNKTLLLGPLLLALLSAACGGSGPLMTPGQDCQRSGCHGEGGGAKRFFVAGTIFPSVASVSDEGLEGATVLVVDAENHQLSLPTNAAGNFYAREDVVFPLVVSVQYGAVTRHMEPAVMEGGCNRCHGVPPREGAEGRAFVHPGTP